MESLPNVHRAAECSERRHLNLIQVYRSPEDHLVSKIYMTRVQRRIVKVTSFEVSSKARDDRRRM